MSEVSAHKHCKECNLSIPSDTTYCSKKCEDAYETYRKKQWWKFALLFIFATAMIVLSFWARL